MPRLTVTLLTPEQRGAVATIAVQGTQAAALVETLFEPARPGAVQDRPLGRIIFGRWRSEEEIVACRRDERTVELHCHGGRAAARAIIADLVEQGCVEIDWQESIRRATPDAIQAAARIALASARTERTAMILWDQQAGALRRELEAIATLLADDASEAVHRFEALLAWAPLGAHLTESWQVVLAGRPNVGKSSLINALLGFQRAIVHDAPGTTRDVVTAATALDGWPVELADTAGLWEAGEPLEAAGIELARQRLQAADLVVLVFDASNWTTADEQLAARWPQALRVFNKCDLVQREPASLDVRLPLPGVLASALKRQGLNELQRSIVKRLVPDQPAPGQAMPFLPAQVAALEASRAALLAGRAANARQLIASVL